MPEDAGQKQVVVVCGLGFELFKSQPTTPDLQPYVPTLFAIIAALVAIAYGAILIRWILNKPEGDDKMKSIAMAIQQGANAYLQRQMKAIGIVAAIVFVLLVTYVNFTTALGFLVGAILSAVAGYIGMQVSVRANIRTAEAAKTGMTEALEVAFRGGSITGILVVGLALLGVAGFYGLTQNIGALVGQVWRKLDFCVRTFGWRYLY